MRSIFLYGVGILMLLWGQVHAETSFSWPINIIEYQPGANAPIVGQIPENVLGNTELETSLGSYGYISVAFVPVETSSIYVYEGGTDEPHSIYIKKLNSQNWEFLCTGGGIHEYPINPPAVIKAVKIQDNGSSSRTGGADIRKIGLKYEVIDINNGLITYYPFNGNANDASANRNHGIILGDIDYVAGVSAYSIEMNGNDCVVANNQFTYQDETTVAAWINFTGGTQNPRILSWSDSAEFFTLSTGGSRRLGVHYGSSNLETTTTVSSNQWHYVCFTADQQAIKLYINGELSESSNYTGIPLFGQAIVGKHGTRDTDYWGGMIDELRIYDRALSEAEISTLYNAKRMSISNITVLPRNDTTGLVDIQYTLENAEDTLIDVMLSDNTGNSWEGNISAVSGDIQNVGSGRKRIIWNSKVDLPNTYGDNYKIKLVAQQGTIEKTAESGIFEIDNRNNVDGPIVTRIESKYCSPDNQKTYFIDGVSLEQEFEVEVDWNGKNPSQIMWFRNSSEVGTDTVNGDSISKIFNVGNDFGVGGGLYVQAIADDGSKSAKVKADFEVINTPANIPSEFFIVNEGGTLEYHSWQIPSTGLGFPKIQSHTNVSDSNNQLYEVADCDWSPLNPTLPIDIKIGGYGFCEIHIDSEMLSGESSFKIGKQKFKTTLEAYITAKYSNGQWLPGGGIDVSVSGDKSFGPKYHIFLAGPVPIPTYIKATIEAMVGANLQVNGISNDGFQFRGEMPVNASVEIAIGVGISNALAVEGYLGGGVKLVAQFPDEPMIKEHLLELNGGIRAYFLFYTYENNLLHIQWPEEAQTAMVISNTMMSSGFVPMERSYLAGNYAVWNGGTYNKSMGSQEVIQSNVFGQSNPIMAVSGNNKCLVWQYDDPERNSLDRTMLVYSINDGNSWSEPQTIDDDGTADANPSIAVDGNGHFVCVWANASGLIPDGTELNAFVDKLDIQMAVYNASTEQWTSETVTSATALDFNAKVISDDSGNIHVVWTHDDNNDMLAESDVVTNKLMLRTKSLAGWGAIQELHSFNGLIQYADIASDSEGSHVVVSVDTDSDFQTDGDNELFYINNVSGSWSTATRLTNDAVADVNPQLVRTSSDLMLLWAKDGKIVSTTDITGMTGVVEAVDQDGSSGQRGFVAVVSPTDNISVVWNDPSDEGSDFYIATYDPTMNVWSNVVQMTDDRDMERSVTAVYSAGDTLELAYNKVHIEEGNGLDVFGQVDLCANTYTIGSDLTVLDGSIVLSDPNAVPGDMVDIQATISNVGDIAVSDIPVSFYNGQVETENLIASYTINGELAAGDSAISSVSWTVPVSVEPIDVVVVIDPDVQIEDKNRLNNTSSMQLFGANLSIDNVIISAEGSGDYYITADVVNSGFIPTYEGITFDLLAGDNELANEDVVALEPGQSQTITFQVLSEQISYGMVEMELVVDKDDHLEESSESDNIRSIVLNNSVPYDFVLDGEINILDLEVLSSQWLRSDGGLTADIAPGDGDGVVNLIDLSVLASHWQEVQN